MQPVISFVIPVYKKPAEVFHKCLSSLFDMSFKDIEVICVFDGADESLRTIADTFHVKQIVVEHGGAPKARNAGLDVATGKYVCFWDADCYAKPEMAKRWLEEFAAVPDADFVYTGYDFAQEGVQPFQSESFDAYSLGCGNYISTMTPVLRSKAPRWDELLEAAQDWDYWMTAVQNGLKGVWIEGSGFVTDTYDTGLSSTKWSAENRDKTIRTVRHKHGVPDREIGVFSMNYRERAIKLAEILEADLIKPTGFTPTVYKTIFNLGYNFMSRFDGIAEDVCKIQYWLPGEIEGLRDAKYSVVMETIRIAKGVINYCNTPYEKNKLEELGITAEVLPLPLADKELEKVSTALPEKFTVLVATDKAYSDLLKDLALDLPHIDFKYNAAKVSEFSCFLSFYRFAALDNAILIAQVNGRHVISNVQAPYCGFVDPDQSWEKFKLELFGKIHEVKAKLMNIEAQRFYLEAAQPKTFKEAIQNCSKIALEVIA